MLKRSVLTEKRNLLLAAGGLAALAVVAGAVAVTYAQQGAVPKITRDDREDIMEVYSAYTRYFDYADVDPHEMVKKVWTSDGMFVNLSTPKDGQCPQVPGNAPIGQWKTASHDLIKGSIPDKLGVKVCVGQVTGWDEMAWRATNMHNMRGTLWRTMVRMPYLEAVPGGILVTLPAIQYYWEPGGEKMSGSGTYQDLFVKTADGWRIKKRVWTPDSVVGAWRPAGAKAAHE
jgi:hypothetical protein